MRSKFPRNIFSAAGPLGMGGGQKVFVKEVYVLVLSLLAWFKDMIYLV